MTIVKFKNTGNAERIPFVPSIFGNLFNDFMYGDLVEKDVFKSLPAVNISEMPEKFIVELAVPGMKKEDFKVEIENRLLTIRAEKNEEMKTIVTQEKNFHILHSAEVLQCQRISRPIKLLQNTRMES
jgi:HSP20 family protein